jgi:hypothetical protein
VKSTQLAFMILYWYFPVMGLYWSPFTSFLAVSYRMVYSFFQANLWRAIGQNPTEADLKRIIEENDTGTGHFQLDACRSWPDR